MAIGDATITGSSSVTPNTTDTKTNPAAKSTPKKTTTPIKDGEKLQTPRQMTDEGTASLELKKPGDAKATAEAPAGEQTKELGFIRKGLDFLRKHVAHNPWIRAAVSIASLLIPGLGFLSLIMLALDGILLLDKLIAGEKITLGDFFSFAAGATAAAVDAKHLLPLTQMATAGFQLFERWLKDRNRHAEQVAKLAACEKHDLENKIADLRRRSDQACAADAKADPQLADDLADTMAAVRQKEQKLGKNDDAGRKVLQAMSAQVAEMIANVEKAHPGWLESLHKGCGAAVQPQGQPA